MEKSSEAKTSKQTSNLLSKLFPKASSLSSHSSRIRRCNRLARYQSLKRPPTSSDTFSFSRPLITITLFMSSAMVALSTKPSKHRADSPKPRLSNTLSNCYQPSKYSTGIRLSTGTSNLIIFSCIMESSKSETSASVKPCRIANSLLKLCLAHHSTWHPKS